MRKRDLEREAVLRTVKRMHWLYGKGTNITEINLRRKVVLVKMNPLVTEEQPFTVTKRGIVTFAGRKEKAY